MFSQLYAGEGTMTEHLYRSAEFLGQMLRRQFCGRVVVQCTVYARHIFHVLKYCTDVVAYDDNGAMAVERFEHVVHLLLKALVYVGVGLIEYEYFRLRNHGTGE